MASLSSTLLVTFYMTFALLLLLLCSHVVSARYHHHGHRGHHNNKKQHKHNSHISYPPSISPEPSPSAGDEGVYDVRSFGAVGDGVTDDTEGFKAAWDAACQVQSAVIHVPLGYSFMIQSTIFTGPCQSGLVFQVQMQLFLSFSYVM